MLKFKKIKKEMLNVISSTKQWLQENSTEQSEIITIIK